MLKLLVLGIAVLLPVVAQAGETLAICYRADAAPFSYIGEDGQPMGYSIAICKAAAKELEREPLMVEVKSNDRFEMLIEKKVCDMLCEATSITMERRERLEFSLITFLTGSALLYPSHLLEPVNGDRRVTVGYLRGTTVAERRRAGTLIGGQRADFHFQPFDDHKTAATALAEGKIQSYIADREILQAILDENKGLMNTHRLSRDSITYEPYAVAVRIGSDDLRIALDRVLVEMFRSGSIQDLLTEHIPDRRFDPMLESLFAIQSLPD